MSEQPHENQIGSSHGLVKRLGPAAILAGAWAVLPMIGGFLVLGFMGPISEFLVGGPKAGAEWAATGLVLYVLIFVFSAGFGLLPTYSQAILAGFAFGVGVGFPAAMAGFGGASLVGYFVASRVSHDRVGREIEANAKARAVRDALIGSGFWKTLGIVTLVRMPPNSPFALTNLLLSATGVPKRVFVLGTVIGMSPRTLVAVWIGSQLEDWGELEKPKWLLIGGIVLTLLVLVVVGKIAGRALEHVTNGVGSGEDASEDAVGDGGDGKP